MLTRKPQIFLKSVCVLWHPQAGLHTLSSRLSPQETEGLSVRECYQILGVPEGCDQSVLRDAYISLAKLHHPDSPTDAANAVKFQQVLAAYNTIQSHLAGSASREHHTYQEEQSKDVDFGIRHTAPQHRQYLSYEGVGMGTPSQRQKQYRRHRVQKASDHVYEYKRQRLYAHDETSLVQDFKIRSAMDRLVEDLITELMARGEFDNLPGKGQPLAYTNHNPYVDTMTHNLNKILINNGYVPEWVQLEKDVRKEMPKAREELMSKRRQLGPEPLPVTAKHRWDEQVSKFTETVNNINAKITKLNMVVPSLRQQMMPYSVEREIQRVIEEYRQCPTVPLDQSHAELTNRAARQGNSHQLTEVWKHIKALFTSM